MHQDQRTGLWLPENVSIKHAPFPPTLNVPCDTKPPTHMHGQTSDRGVTTGGWWGTLPKPYGSRPEPKRTG